MSAAVKGGRVVEDERCQLQLKNRGWLRARSVSCSQRREGS